MCNLVSLTVKRWELVAYYQANDDFRREVELEKDYVSPTRPGLVVREQDGQRVVDEMRWGFPHWQPGKPDVVNVRNYKSPFWRKALTDPDRRCLVPFTRFQEWSVEPDPITGKKKPYFFHLPSRPIGTFAGVWQPTETGPRFAFLTTGYCDTDDTEEARAAAAAAHIVGAIHPKAIPVILDGEPEFETWLKAPVEEALQLATAYPSQLIAIE